MKKCEALTSERDHDAQPIFGTIAYVRCGKPAAWLVETDGIHEMHACESHARDALLYRHDSVTDANGEDIDLDPDTHELRVAS